MPPAHVACLAMLAPVMTMREGAAIYAPSGELMVEGDVLRQPGLVAALELVRDEGAASVYSGTIARSLLDLVQERGGAITAADLEGYAPVWSEPAAVEFAGRRVLHAARPVRRPRDACALRSGRRRRRAARCARARSRDGRHTTNLTVVDAEAMRAC